MKNWYKIRYSLMIGVFVTLAGCSGGGGGTAAVTPAPAPAPAPTTAPTTPTAATSVNMTVSGKALNFTWAAGSNVDHYRISVNPDGASGFTVDPYASHISNAATSYSLTIAVHKTNWLAAQYIVEACDASDATCVASPNQTLALIDSMAATVYAKASNTEANDSFGTAVSISADGYTLAVGAYLEDSVATGIGGVQTNNAAADSGAVYVFSRVGATWAQQAYLKASNTGAGDWFGVRVSLSADGNTLAVGAYQEDSATTGIGGVQTNNAALNSGAVYVFSRVGATWMQQAYVKASNTGAGDNFGRAVSLSTDGNTLAAGADLENSIATGIGGNQVDNSALGSGAVYVFSRMGATWTQQAYVKASNTDAYDQFGRAVSLSGDANTLAVGADSERSIATGIGGNQVDNSATNAGAVYLY